MKLLQVKTYHNTIAREKQRKAVQRFKDSNQGYGYPVDSMFYFLIGDMPRQKGYVAFNEVRAVFGKNSNEAIQKFTV